MISSGLLVCAVLGSLGVGVLAAQAICVGMFRVFRIHARQVAAARELNAEELTVPVQVRLDVVGTRGA